MVAVDCAETTAGSARSVQAKTAALERTFSIVIFPVVNESLQMQYTNWHMSRNSFRLASGVALA
jgi:hypothetical protein